jgi:hypothetical protein
MRPRLNVVAILIVSPSQSHAVLANTVSQTRFVPVWMISKKSEAGFTGG